MPNDPRLECALRRVPEWRGLPIAATPLDGGITNRAWRLHVGGDAFFARVSAESAGLLGIERESERACAGIAAGLGIAPEVVHCSTDLGVLITRFVDGRVMTPSALAVPRALQALAQSIRLLHRGPPFSRPFSPFAAVRSYARLSGERSLTLPPGSGKALGLNNTLARALSPPPHPLPCHNDLVPENVVRDRSGRLWIVDWEYAGMGDPFFDLGIVAAYLELEDEGCARLLAAYGVEPAPAQMARLRLMAVVSDLRDAFWSFLQAGISELAFDFSGYGEKFLARTLERSARPEFRRWLDELSAGA